MKIIGVLLIALGGMVAADFFVTSNPITLKFGLPLIGIGILLVGLGKSDVSQPPADASAHPAPPVLVQHDRPGICYRCQREMVPRIIERTDVKSVAGALVNHVAVYVPHTKVFFTAECPLCGVPLQSVDADRMNQEIEDRETKKTQDTIFVLFFVLLGVLGLVVAAIYSSSR